MIRCNTYDTIQYAPKYVWSASQEGLVHAQVPAAVQEFAQSGKRVWRVLSTYFVAWLPHVLQW
jgi:hypothetical protein